MISGCANPSTITPESSPSVSENLRHIDKDKIRGWNPRCQFRVEFIDRGGICETFVVSGLKPLLIGGEICRSLCFDSTVYLVPFLNFGQSSAAAPTAEYLPPRLFHLQSFAWIAVAAGVTGLFGVQQHDWGWPAHIRCIVYLYPDVKAGWLPVYRKHDLGWEASVPPTCSCRRAVVDECRRRKRRSNDDRGSIALDAGRKFYRE